MNTHTVNRFIPATTAPTSKYVLTPAEKTAVDHALAEFKRTDALLEDVQTLKERFQTVGQDFANGKIDILTASSLLTAGADRVDRTELRGWLRGPVKQLQREILTGISDIITKARQHAVAELLGKCSTLEKVERTSAADLGISADDFQPSGTLQSLREQHRRAVATIENGITRTDLNVLVAD